MRLSELFLIDGLDYLLKMHSKRYGKRMIIELSMGPVNRIVILNGMYYHKYVKPVIGQNWVEEKMKGNDALIIKRIRTEFLFCLN